MLIVVVGVSVDGGVAPTPAAAASCTISTTLRSGSTGTQVRCVQSTLNAEGFTAGPVDGKFGSMTASAVRAYQRSRGLYVDGVVGPKTAASLGIWATSSTGGTGGTTQNPACLPPGGVPSSAKQVVVVNATGTYAKVDLLVYSNGVWTCARTGMPARVGRNGIRQLAERRSGDGTTPAGVFPLGSMTAPNGQTFQFFGNGTNPGVKGTWRQVRSGDCWVTTPGDPAYNTLVTRTSAKCTGDDEYLTRYYGSYTQAALIGANMGPHRSGDDPGEPALAAAIFLHRYSYTSTGATKPTSGCVSMSLTNLSAVLRRLVPGEAWFVIR